MACKLQVVVADVVMLGVWQCGHVWVIRWVGEGAVCCGCEVLPQFRCGFVCIGHGTGTPVGSYSLLSRDRVSWHPEPITRHKRLCSLRPRGAQGFRGRGVEGGGRSKTRMSGGDPIAWSRLGQVCQGCAFLHTGSSIRALHSDGSSFFRFQC